MQAYLKITVTTTSRSKMYDISRLILSYLLTHILDPLFPLPFVFQQAKLNTLSWLQHVVRDQPT